VALISLSLCVSSLSLLSRFCFLLKGHMTGVEERRRSGLKGRGMSSEEIEARGSRRVDRTLATAWCLKYTAGLGAPAKELSSNPLTCDRFSSEYMLSDPVGSDRIRSEN
jgi:hypothetical protein